MEKKDLEHKAITSNRDINEAECVTSLVSPCHSNKRLDREVKEEIIEEYDPILNLIKKDLKTSGQEIIVRDRIWSYRFNCFIVHKEEDVIAAAFKLLSLKAINNRDLVLNRCSQEEEVIWHNYYMVSVKKSHNHLESEISKLNFLKNAEVANSQ